MELFGYKKKRVIVSGCYSGMGEATARLLVQLGAEVHGLDYKASKLDLASFRHVDLRDPASIDAAVAGIGGKVDALFNCAGLPQTFPPLDVMKVNYIGTRYLTERVLPLMTKGSAICSISSNGGLGWSRRVPVHMELLRLEGYDAALRWVEGHADIVREGYAFSKETIIVWTMSSSFRLIQQGIRRSTPEEQAAALIFLNSDAASYINGVSLPVDGGFMGGLAMGLIDLTKMMGPAA